MKKLLIIAAMTLFAVSAAMAADGEALYKASCAGCHGGDGSKSAGGTTPLKDQDADTLLKHLQGYAAGTYGGEHKAVMENVAKKHPAEELKAVADYIGKK